MGMNMIFTIFAFVFFGTLLVFNSNLIVNSLTLASENEVSLIAISEAQSVIDEAKEKSFDENTLSVEAPDSQAFSGTLGREGGETFPFPLDTLSSTGFRSSVNFDDVDDYNGYKRLVKASSGGGGDTVSVAVQYVSVSNPNTPAVGRTYAKKMLVTVKSPFLNQAYNLSYLFTY